MVLFQVSQQDQSINRSMNYPLSRGKWDAMEGGIRVPFIVAGPNVIGETESVEPVIGYDILPTIIDLINPSYKSVKGLEGGSFKEALFSGGQGRVKRPFDGFVFHVPYANGIALKRAHSAIIKGRYKLVKFRDNKELMLFDLEQDIYEKNNLIDRVRESDRENERYIERDI